MVRKFPPPRKIVDPDNPPTLTPRQLQIMRFIRDYRASRGYSPTMDELAAHMDVSKVTVFEHVGALEHKGLLKRTPHKARSLQISKLMSWPPDEDAVAPVPKPFEFLLAGRIAAGRPIEAIEDRETLDLASMFDTRYGTYVLRVSGQSMIDDHICDGDFVIVERRTAARDGETVVALLEDGHATLKRFYRQGGRIRLQPANEQMEPIYVDQVEIQGVVIGVLRQC